MALRPLPGIDRRTSEVAAKLEVIGHGDGGVDELAKYLNDAEVLWAILRFELGSGSFKRTKTVLMHFNGDDCPAVQRARENAHINDVRLALRSGQDGETLHACIELKRKDEVTAAYILRIVTEFFVVDHVGEFRSTWEIRESFANLGDEQRRVDHRESPSRRERHTLANAKELAALRDEMISHACSSKTADVVATGITKDMKIKGGWRSAGLGKFQFGRDALRSVAVAGPWNWALVGPDSSELPLLGAGSGSVDEMRTCAKEHEDLVMFGLLRLDFGTGRLKRTRYAFVHLIGTQVPTVKRGRMNAVRPAMEVALKSFANCTIAFHDLSVEDLVLAMIIERVRQVCIVDDDVLARDAGTQSSIFSVEAFRQAMAFTQAEEPALPSSGATTIDMPAQQDHSSEEQTYKSPPRRSRLVSEAGSESSASARQSAPRAGSEVEEALRLVHHDGSCNWALFRMRNERLGSKMLPTSPSASSAGGCLTLASPLMPSLAASERDDEATSKVDVGLGTGELARVPRPSVRQRALQFEPAVANLAL